MATNIAMYPNARLTPNNEIERKNKKQAFPLSSRLLPVHPNIHQNDRNAIMNIKLFDLIFVSFLVSLCPKLNLRIYIQTGKRLS